MAGIWEDVSDQRECRRHDGGSAEPQECTRDDEGGSAGREGRQHTGHPEAGGANEQNVILISEEVVYLIKLFRMNYFLW